jgi:hypothetical protein
MHANTSRTGGNGPTVADMRSARASNWAEFPVNCKTVVWWPQTTLSSTPTGS